MIHKVICKSPDDDVGIQIGHMFIDSRQDSTVANLRRYRAARTASDRYVVQIKTPKQRK